MTARVYCAVLLCLSGCLSSTEANLPVPPGLSKCLSKYYSAEECTWIRFVSCANDQDCAKNEKCCYNGCGLQCGPIALVTVKAGVCPSRYSYTEKDCAVMRFKWMCDHDSDCPNNEKCCSNGCVPACMAPVTVKPGVCPSKHYTAEECARIRYVMAPKECGDDSACPKNEKCCSNGCIRQCVAPVPAVKPGVCPSKYYTAKQCAVMRFKWMCDHDSDCPNNEKCCSNGCVLECMAPVKVKPGVCPRRLYTTKECARIRFKPCVKDSDCPKNEKCCHNGCGLQCMAPVKVLSLDPEMDSALLEINAAQPPVVTHAVDTEAE